MAQAGYGGSMSIGSSTMDVEEWTLSGERSIIDATPLSSIYKTVVAGRISHTGTAVIQWSSATKGALTSYFSGATPTQTTVTITLKVNATENFSFSALLSGFDHAQPKDDQVRVTVRFVASGQMTTT